LNYNKKIFTFGDGFATGHLWPEWPQILQALLPDYQIINTAGIGAGCEFLVSGLVDHINSMKDSVIIFQWPHATRFDKLIEDDSWQQIIANDPVYHFNTTTDNRNQQWWLSSASTAPDIELYHKQYVQLKQHKNRYRVYRELINHTATALNCKIFHTSSKEEDMFSRQLCFSNSRQKEVQPSPIVHLCWLTECVLPQISVAVDPLRHQRLTHLIDKTQWRAYDPDRIEIWVNICAQL
jgi:hypothetical protein